MGDRHQLRRLLEDSSRPAFLLKALMALQKDLILTGPCSVYEDILSSWELVYHFCALFKKSGLECHMVACDQGLG